MFKLKSNLMGRMGGGGGMDGGGGGGGGMGGGGMGGACYTYPASPATPGLATPDVVYNRGIYMNGSMTMDDGNSVRIWGFTDGGGGMGGGGNGMDMGNSTFPSPAMRVYEGEIVHSNLDVNGMMWVHTIHHHGIEPSMENDGVGHISWDVDGSYTYQWRPSSAGTYFYHCHTNTVLHAEMGMYGALIVDPRPDPNDPEGTKRAFKNGPIYDAEVIWAVDEIDSSWHSKSWDAGTCGSDAGLNILEPDYFIITGVDGAQSALTAPGIAATVEVGQTLLVRYICAGYHPQEVRLGGLTATMVASDARPLPNAVPVQSFKAISAERYDLIIEATEPGEYVIEIDINDWITGQTWGTARTKITII
ncbi:MAG: multicopper oxidase domain-containing protein [Methylococcales bacterium]|nr:multicopper oxidase domain-containing protein [Methylococcales bacterium]